MNGCQRCKHQLSQHITFSFQDYNYLWLCLHVTLLVSNYTTILTIIGVYDQTAYYLSGSQPFWYRHQMQVIDCNKFLIPSYIRNRNIRFTTSQRVHQHFLQDTTTTGISTQKRSQKCILEKSMWSRNPFIITKRHSCLTQKRITNGCIT